MPAKRCFIDTNVLIYSLSADSAKAARADQILHEGGVISAQVLNELANVLRRKQGMSWAEVREVSSLFQALLDVAPVTADVHAAGLNIGERYGTSVYDAMIIAAALEAKCEILYSEDMQHGMVIGTLQIENPFI